MKTGVKVLVFIGVILFVVVALFVGSRIWFNYIWFNNLDFVNVFTKILWTKIGLWWSGFVLFILFAGINVRIAYRKGGIQSMKFQQGGVPVEITKTIGIVITTVVLLLIALIMARNASGKWDMILKFANRTPFGTKDPMFGRDLSFYVFTLPIFGFFKSWSLGTLAITIIVVGLLNLVSGRITLEQNKATISDQAKRHLIFLFSLIALIAAWNYALKILNLPFVNRGLIAGARYTDARIVRPASYIMMAVAGFTFVLSLTGIKKKSFKEPLIGFGVLIGAAILLTGIIPGIAQQLSVRPNELVRELSYIKNTIEFTRMGYNLNSIEREAFPVADSLTAADFSPDTGINKNIRLWDDRPLRTTFRQIQTFRLYYDFFDVDVDRYRFGKDLRQVTLSAREINYGQFPFEARTWVNERLQFTHGYGLVMAPVNEIGEEGLPQLFVKDIPPKMSVPLQIDRPEIYFGELTLPYVIVNTDLPEFDYPKGDTNVTTRYTGSGGIPFKNPLRKLLMAIHLKSFEIVFTNYLKPDSRILIYRSIQERIPKIGPFLKYDPNPYLVVSGGKLYYMLDAYTVTDRIPYSQRYREGYNYIRNSVKITMDAYTGDVKFYVFDDKDPIVQTLKKAFPTMFKDKGEMPADLLEHIRYPSYIFGVQAELYSTYHMTDPTVFYNKEDKWTTPKEIYGDAETDMVPYYAIVRFPDKGMEEAEFVLILPFTPSNKNNMVAWMAAKCDPKDYGRIVEYKFPKEKLIFGPMQIESRVDQQPEISQFFTLWGQKGSKIIRGNLLVIPVKDSLIYVEPVYLQSEQSELPELKRVIVAYMDNIAMGNNLEDALAKVFGTAGEKSARKAESIVTEKGVTESRSVKGLIEQAGAYYDEAQQKLKSGDFAGYGESVRRLGDVLKKLETQVK